MASVEPVQDGCIHIEKINAPFIVRSGSKFGAGLRYAIEKSWPELHESRTYVRAAGAWRGPARPVSRSAWKTAKRSGTRREQFPDTAMRCASNILRNASDAMMIAYSRVRA